MTVRSWRQGVTGYQWLVLFVAWLGWVFDAMDATIYAIVLHPALHELLQTTPAAAVPAEQIGWAIGGITFGILADRFGRAKVLMVTIILYVVFTDAAALSQNWLHLAIYRFLTALGIGGEWAAGAAIFGYLGFGPLADRFGRRPVFAFMCLGSFIMLPVTYLLPWSYAGVLMLLPILGFFNNGIFSGFPIYLPELYPTALRATGAGLCFN